MFNEKQRRINQLEAAKRTQDAELTTLRPWIGVAQEIEKRSTSFAASVDLEQAIDLAVQQLSEERRRAFIEAAFQQLDPDRQLETLSKVYGDDVIKMALEEEHQRKLAELDKTTALDLIIKEGREHKRLQFRNIPLDSKVVMHFYQTGFLDRERLDLNKSKRKITGIMQNGGMLAVLDDSLREFSEPIRYKYEDYQKIAISLPNGTDGPLYYGVGAKLPSKEANNSNFSPMYLDLGPVFIDEIDIFGLFQDFEQEE